MPPWAWVTALKQPLDKQSSCSLTGGTCIARCISSYRELVRKLRRTGAVRGHNACGEWARLRLTRPLVVARCHAGESERSLPLACVAVWASTGVQSRPRQDARPDISPAEVRHPQVVQLARLHGRQGVLIVARLRHVALDPGSSA